MKVIRKQLIEAATTYTDFKSKYNISAFNEKTNFLVCLFYCFFLRRQIYEFIAAIFWQSAFHNKKVIMVAANYCFSLSFAKRIFHKLQTYVGTFCAKHSLARAEKHN